MSNTKPFPDPDLVEKIQTELVDTSYYNDIKYNIHSKSRWKLTADITGACSHICVCISIVLAFAAGFFNYTVLSFISGCFGTTSLALLRFSAYALIESKERTEQVNLLLGALGMNKIVDITVDETQ